LTGSGQPLGCASAARGAKPEAAAAWFMHEVSLMTDTLELATRSARAAGASRIHALRLRVGQLSGVVPEALRFAFEALRPGTPAAEATLDIETVPARWWCRHCAREFDGEPPWSECPTCGQPSGEARAGFELELASMEVS